jgi:superoxide dismutase
MSDETNISTKLDAILLYASQIQPILKIQPRHPRYSPYFFHPELFDAQQVQQAQRDQTERNKKPVRESIKKYIASRQQWKCNHCQQLLNHTYEVDHILPREYGGGNEPDNLQALCRNCHGSKTFDQRLKQSCNPLSFQW